MQDIEASVLSVSPSSNGLSETLDVLGKMATDLEGRIVGTRPMADAPGSAAVPPPPASSAVSLPAPTAPSACARCSPALWSTSDEHRALEANDPDFDPTDEFLDGDPITVEEQARAMGWKPLSEYNGDPRRWTDAEAFVKKGLEELPVLRDQNHRLTTKLTRMGTEIGNLRNTVTEQTKAVQDAIRMARTASQAGYDRAMRELEAKRREAAQTGDIDSFDQIEEQIEALETERAKVDGPRPRRARPRPRMFPPAPRARAWIPPSRPSPATPPTAGSSTPSARTSSRA
jgi:hypothetical protein